MEKCKIKNKKPVNGLFLFAATIHTIVIVSIFFHSSNFLSCS
ncbi:hypothetical protein PCN061_p406 (plasmid) [Escherichia coli PCN061]|nr:hypothetical protein PCN061_p406 [Escherichia coli PCN061]